MLPRDYNNKLSYVGGVPKWLRERSAKPLFTGSNPVAASNSLPKLLKIQYVIGEWFRGVFDRGVVGHLAAHWILVETGRKVLFEDQYLDSSHLCPRVVDAGAEVRYLLEARSEGPEDATENAGKELGRNLVDGLLNAPLEALRGSAHPRRFDMPAPTLSSRFQSCQSRHVQPRVTTVVTMAVNLAKAARMSLAAGDRRWSGISMPRNPPPAGHVSSCQFMVDLRSRSGLNVKENVGS